MLQTKDNSLDYDHILAVLTEKRRQIEEAISAIDQLKRSEAIAVGTTPPAAQKLAPVPAEKKRVISDAGRQRIIEATRKRWAAVRAAKEAAGAPVAKTAAKARKKNGPRKKTV